MSDELLPLEPAESRARESRKAEPTGRTRRQVMRATTVIVIAVVLCAPTAWALSILLKPVPTVEENDFTIVTVEDAEVGASISLNAVAEWLPKPLGTNLASGTVTAMNVAAGQSVDSGTVLYSVNLRPVVIAEGAVPAFRTQLRDVSGADVAQLQSLLSKAGHYDGVVDGKFGLGTEVAVKAFQRALGMSPDGVVGIGDVIYVPSLPAVVALDNEVVAVGNVLNGGEKAVLTLPPEPGFTVPVSSVQAASIPIGATVILTGPDGAVWNAVVSSQTADDQQGISLVLSGDDNVICGSLCSIVPIAEPMILPVEIVIAETVHGPAVPTIALQTRPDGSTIIVDEDGNDHTVTVIQTAQGLSAIDGVASGTRVRVSLE